MNISAIKEGSAAPIAAAVIAGIIGFFGGQYNTDKGAELNAQSAMISAQSSELRSHDLDIESLKAKQAIDEATINGFSSITSQFGSLKTAVEAQTHALEGLQAKVDSIDHWLRPDPNLSHSNAN